MSRGGGGRGQDGGGGGTAAGAPLPDHTRPKLNLYFEKVAQIAYIGLLKVGFLTLDPV